MKEGFSTNTARSRRSRFPSEKDLQIWAEIKGQFSDWGYGGVVGCFQVAGHRLIDRWARAYVDGLVLEVGCGNGHHVQHGGNEYQRYIGLDIEYKFLCTLRERLSGTWTVNGDAHALPLRDQSVDCVLSVYCFEHLRQLPQCLTEIQRVLKPEGELLVGLPAEGGFLYEIGRSLTSKRYIERKYDIDYDALVHWEHWSSCLEVVEEIRRRFVIHRRQHLPLLIPSVHLNAVLVLQASPKRA